MADQKNSSFGSTPRPPMPGRSGRPHGAARFAPVDKPGKMVATLKKLATYLSGARAALLLVFFLIVVDAAVSLLIPYFIGLAVNQIGTAIHHVRFSGLIDFLLVLGSFYLMDGFLTASQGWIMAGAGQKIVMSLRSSLFDKLRHLPIAFFDQHPHGDMMSRLTNDIENIDVTISQSTVQLMNDVLMIGGSFILMIWISPSLTLACLITVPLVFLLTRTIASRTSKLFVAQQNELGLLNSHIEESISGIQVIKAFSHEEEEIKTFTAINRELTDVGTKAQIWSGFLMPLMNVINNLGFTAVAAVGGYLAVKNLITVGMIASFLTYSRQFTRPLNDVASIFNTLLSAIAGAERVFEIIDEPEEERDKSHTQSLKEYKGRLTFDKVGFSYADGHKVLQDISFEAQPGQTIALVGQTGAGKTTLINLLTRFYDATCGRILLDGTDIRHYRRADYRLLFGMVLQEPYLFRGSFIENIRYGRQDASRKEVIQAARAAGCDGFIAKMPQGYDTQLKGNALELSEGQKQLLTIARALLKNPRILVMDEATSHVDSRTEAELQRAMNHLMQGRTCFIIAHRLSTIRHADQILVVREGQIAERGTHEELLRIGGIYQAMYRNQFSDGDG
ncbi:MAG: ABC transporter ATP-binding protein [Sporolactobacillus sp.]